MAKPQPAAKFRLGDVTATVRNNDDFFNTVLSKSYRDGDDWKDTDLLGTGDLLKGGKGEPLWLNYFFGGLPSLAKVNPLMSAAFRSFPALRKASVFSGPGGIARASSNAIWAWASNSLSWRGGGLLAVMGRIQVGGNSCLFDARASQALVCSVRGT
jgi:hypothetical protein